MSTPTPHGREALWAKFTGGEKLAYGCGCRDTRADLLAELEAGVEGLRVAPRKPGESPWGVGFRDSRNETVAAVLDLIRAQGTAKEPQSLGKP